MIAVGRYPLQAESAALTEPGPSHRAAQSAHEVQLRSIVRRKMAKGDDRPLMMTVEKAVDHLEACLLRRPVTYTAPRGAIPLVKLRRLLMRLAR